jgi:short-subunit dehydrogenase
LLIEFVKQLLKQDYEIIATCRNPSQASDLQQLQIIYNNLSMLKLDVTNIKDIQDVKQQIGDKPIDLFISNVGISVKKEPSLGNVDIQDYQNHFLTNAISPIKLLATFAENIIASNEKKFIALSSRMGSISDNSSGGYYAYRGSKAALNAMLYSAAVDLRNHGVKVLLLHPGWVKTDMGGQNAQLEVSDSVSSLLEIINSDEYKTGSYVSFNGQEIAW